MPDDDDEKDDYDSFEFATDDDDNYDNCPSVILPTAPTGSLRPGSKRSLHT